MRSAQRLIASLAVVLTIWMPLLAKAADGRTEGSAAVTPTGSASYSIPFTVPPGINGMTPQLGLIYNSGTDNGVMGVGWSIAGLSVIVRCQRTWAQDGEPREVRLDYNDRFCLDGNKLRLVAGSYGASGTTYRTEIETFSRITSYGTVGNGPEYFVVERNDGLIYEYGATADSRIEAIGQGTPRAWSVSKIRDRAGNQITFAYTEDTVNGSFRISSVAYGGNPAQGVAATHTVSFVYETKPSNEIDSGYIAGSLVKEITRLDRVDVLHGSTVLRRYELTYEGALSSTSKSRLASIQECAGDPLDCFPATTFLYQNGTPGLGVNVNTGVSIPTTPWALDVNGDGRTDLVYSSSVTSGSGVWMVMLANSSGSYNSPVSTGVTNTNYAGAIPIDYDADGREDLLVPYSGGTWWVMLGSASGLASPVNTGTPATATGVGNNARALDVNGDGLDDLVWADLFGWSGGDAIRYRLREWGGTFSSTVTDLAGPMAADSMIEPNVFRLDRSNRRSSQDFNADGRADITFRHSSRFWEPEQNRYIVSVAVTVRCLGAWSFQANWLWGLLPAQFGDFNGDGKTDVAYPAVNGSQVQYSTGKNLMPPIIVAAAGMSLAAAFDWDGDGYDDLLARHVSSGTWYVIRSTGEGFTAPAATGLSAGDSAFTVVDVNGDGLHDLGNVSAGVWDYRIHNTELPDLLGTATDGYGNHTTFSYKPLSAASGRSPATYPAQAYQGSLPIVQSVQSSNGIGGVYTLRYYYGGARINLQGRGFEGFAQRETFDYRNTVSTFEYFNQGFPYTGTISRIQTGIDGAFWLSTVTNTWSHHAYGSGSEAAFLPYVSASRRSRNSVTGSTLSIADTSNSVHAATGVVFDTVTSVREQIGVNGVQPGATHTQRIYRPISELITDTANWCIGRPGRTEYTNSHDQYGGAPITRTVAEAWDTVSCRPTQQVVEPDSSEWRVTRDIGYDTFGNVNSEAVTGIGLPARTTTAYFGSTGRFQQSVTNALSQTTQFGWNDSTGTLASQTDPNGIASSWEYDAFGRRVREVRADGTSTNWQYTDCSNLGCVSSNNKLVVIERQYDSNGSFVRDQRIYTDRFDRPIAAESLMLSGAYSRIDRGYDSFGRVSRESVPRWASGAEYWTTFTYDLLNRVTRVQRPVSAGDAALSTTNIYYEGLRVRVVDALGKQSTRVENAIGAVVRSGDHDGYFQNFDYNGFGDVVRVTDSAGNTLQSSVYNVRGMRISQTDMDMGSWTYVPNPLGEVMSQTDANDSTTSFEYDLLGRLTTRTEFEGTSIFSFGTSAAAHNIGRLVSMAGPGYSEGFAYDAVGRPIQRTITSDATYQINYTYNAIGSLDTLTYPTSTSGYRLKLQYDYQNGTLQRVRDFNAPSTAFWTANDTDPRGAVISETLGNGVQTIRGFDEVTGLLDYIQSGLGGGATLQDASYQWDPVGNLSQRSEATIGATENFTYDNLHRLTCWTNNCGSTPDLTYDALGNISSKAQLGAYTYDTSRKHQVLTAGANSYSYDNNGNVTAKNGHPITWYSYNLPKLITNSGSNSSEFFYAPDRTRWKQIASYGGTAEQTVYIGGLVEKVTLGTVTSWKHYIAGANGMVTEYIRRSSGTSEMVYLLKDHLGSVEVVTSSVGAQLSRLAYDALGSRRSGETWNGLPSSSEWAAITNTTRRGYTFHEMLDNLDLVHMNGRVYDHGIGRFLSADPFVQAPGFTQSFNRYSYTFNNPLSYVDPTGYSSECAGSPDAPSNACNAGDAAAYDGISDFWARMDYIKGEGRRNFLRRWMMREHPEWFRQPTQFPNGRGVGGRYTEPAPVVDSPPPSVSFDTISTVGGTVSPYTPLFRDNFAGRTLQSLDYGLGWLTQWAWDGPTRGLISNLVPTPRELNDAKMGLVLGAVPPLRLGLRPPLSGLGDLTVGEALTIQNVVNQAGRPLEVVGSAARRARRAGSDIDYVVPPSGIRYFDGLERQLPSLDHSHGIVPGIGNPNIGPIIRFEPEL